MSSEQNNRWGVLFCPKVRDSKYRENLQKVLDGRGVDYDFIQSESASSVGRLTRMLVNNGYKTIVIVGGDSALNDAVNCLMGEEKLVREKIALGVIPHGVMNDFARYWGFREKELEQTVDWLTKHRERRIDVGCIRYKDKKGDNCHKYFLNCVNIGFIADVMNLRRQARSLLGSRRLSFVASIFLMVFHRMNYKMRLNINSNVVERNVMNVCIGSGPGYGQTPSAVPYSGLLDVSVVYETKLAQILSGFYLLVSGRFLNHKAVHPFRTRLIEVGEASHALVGVDGRPIGTPEGAYRITIEPEAVTFLIPD